MKGLRLACTGLVVGVAGCALPHVGGSFAATSAEYAAPLGGGAETPIVQVRGYWRSALVSVVAWDMSDAAFGLRTSVTRSGELVGGDRFGDHSLYMTPLYARDMGGFKYASIIPGRLLRRLGPKEDPYACFYGRKCSPMVSVGVRIPDSLLRATRDSLVVTFFPSVHEPWTITLRPELIAAYLNRVDSVIAGMK